ncbi:unnamed protein product [Protopolystoma xenopodis]|uniref:Uncharacterized protein n=1 Tax=Protopolystoma xenopodis TaxID=117903 RepID=A0A448XIW4_9PLAT|nr:unnamed protein product [Protopolystoma xenopodis]
MDFVQMGGWNGLTLLTIFSDSAPEVILSTPSFLPVCPMLPSFRVEVSFVSARAPRGGCLLLLTHVRATLELMRAFEFGRIMVRAPLPTDTSGPLVRQLARTNAPDFTLRRHRDSNLPLRVGLGLEPMCDRPEGPQRHMVINRQASNGAMHESLESIKHGITVLVISRDYRYYPIRISDKHL